MTRIANKSTKFYSFLSVILIIYMILINNVQNSILSLITIMVSAIFIIKPLYILPPLFIASLMGEYFVAFQGIGMSRVMVIIFIIGSFIEFIKSSTKIKLRHVLFILFLVGFNFISAANSITGTIKPAITMALNIVMLFCFTYTKIDDLGTYLKTMTMGSMILSIYIFIFVALGNAQLVSDRLVLDEAVNANQIGMALAQISAYIFGMLLVQKEKKLKFIYLFVIIINIINLFLTGSRSATFGYLATIIIVTFIEMFRVRSMNKKLPTFAVITFLIVGVYLGMSNSGLRVLQRFTITNVLESGGTGRTLIWESLSRYIIPANLWFGVGFGGQNVAIAVSPYIPVALGAHNIVMAIIVQTGIVGSTIYLSFFFKCIKDIFKGYTKNYYLIIPLIMVLTAFLNGIGEDIFSERFLWFAIGLGFMFLNQYNRTFVKIDGVSKVIK
jgi:O-antigen ligase